MTLWVLIISFICIIFFIYLTLILIKYLNKKYFSIQKKTDEINFQLNWISYFLLFIAFSLICLSFLAPLIFTLDSLTEDFDFSNTGEIGDTIGGLMSPFIAIGGVIVTGLAFYMQYQANLLQRQIFYKQLAEDKNKFTEEIEINKQQFEIQLDAQKKQLQLQQYEAQFYEMLRLHKENVNEIELFAKRKIEEDESVNFEDYIVTKRNAFVELKKEFEFLLFLYRNYVNPIDQNSFSFCYELFFWGLKEKGEKREKDDSKLQKIQEYKKILNYLKNSQFVNEPNPDLLFINDINFNIFAFEGHSEFLGHYYRHLFHTVKYVVSVDLLTYGDKIRYLRILRAQLSNHEQMMLFYNWLSGYGDKWENDENQFFTEYCMIHNLWYNELFDDPYITQFISFLKNKPVTHRSNTMFEIDT